MVGVRLNETWELTYSKNRLIDVSCIPRKALSGWSYNNDPMTFEAEGIRKLFQVLDPEKRKRPDNILTQILRETASEIKEDVCFLF